MYRDIPEELREVIEPIVEAHGLELVDAEVHRGRGPWVVRVVVDNPEGDGRVPVERCADVSREVGTHLDAADAIPVRYRLEVSSPGLSRVLAREKDFAAACGQQVRLETRRPLDGRRRFQGRLLALEDGTLRIEVEGRAIDIPMPDVVRANTVYQFSREDFARGSGR